MDVDLRPLQKALRELRFTTPLAQDDSRYVARTDDLRQKLLNRILAPTERILLIGGPAGCGKSTELLRLQHDAWERYTVYHCPCDRDLDLYRLTAGTLYRYVLWRLLYVSLKTPLSNVLTLTPEITQEAMDHLGLQDVVLDNPALFFSSPQLWEEPQPSTRLLDTLMRLLSEIERSFLPTLLLFDGFEKAPQEVFSNVIEDFIRSPVFTGSQSVFVLPQWTLYGWRSAQRWASVEVFQIPIIQDPYFIKEVIVQRTGEVISRSALDVLSAYSGGLLRDALQLATNACRAALDSRSSTVERNHAEFAAFEMRKSYRLLFSDNLDRAQDFLRVVLREQRLPPDPDMRDRMLSVNAVLPLSDDKFSLHPVLWELL
ncbi:MAG TPA: ATP-binding protein [Archangium sp.]|nr:ATP-binding protein [Archangium sp.]